MASVPKPLDYQAYLSTPEIRRRYDIIDGEFHFMSPSPGWFHQKDLGQVHTLLQRHVEPRRLGHVMVAPLDVIISKNPMRTRQPDVLFVSHARLKLIDERLHSAPDLVVEILSPGNTAKKAAEKLRDYALIGVKEAWVADRKTGAITVLHPEGGEFRETAVYRPGQRLRSKVLPQLRLDVDKIFCR
jgi:Uma2 family endonuclease